MASVRQTLGRWRVPSAQVRCGVEPVLSDFWQLTFGLTVLLAGGVVFWPEL